MLRIERKKKKQNAKPEHKQRQSAYRKRKLASMSELEREAHLFKKRANYKRKRDAMSELEKEAYRVKERTRKAKKRVKLKCL